MMFTIRGIPTAGIAVRDGVRAATPRIRRCYGRGRRPRGRGRAVPCGAGACEGGAVRTGGRGGCFRRPSGDGRATRCSPGWSRGGLRKSTCPPTRRSEKPAKSGAACSRRSTTTTCADVPTMSDVCARIAAPVGRNRPRSLCRAGSGDDRGGRRAGAFGYGTDGFQQGRRIGDGARKRDEPCRDHRPEQGHRGAGRRCRVHAAGQNRRPADNRRGAGRTDRRSPIRLPDANTPCGSNRCARMRSAAAADAQAPAVTPGRAADHGAGQCRERSTKCDARSMQAPRASDFSGASPLTSGARRSPHEEDAVCGHTVPPAELCRGTSADCTDT